MCVGLSSDYLPPTKVLFVFTGAVQRDESAWHPECTEEEALVLMDKRARQWLKGDPSLPVESGGAPTDQTCLLWGGCSASLKWQCMCVCIMGTLCHSVICRPAYWNAVNRS